MRGSPLLRAALAFLILLGLAPLLWQMTRPAASAPVATAAPPSGPSKIHLDLAFTTAPARVSIKHLGKVIWTKDAPEASEEADLPLPWPKEGGELHFQIEWPADAPLSAMRAVLTDPKRNEIERSAWGRGTVDQVLGFP
jgi:hypothetical protein